MPSIRLVANGEDIVKPGFYVTSSNRYIVKSLHRCSGNSLNDRIVDNVTIHGSQSPALARPCFVPVNCKMRHVLQPESTLESISAASSSLARAPLGPAHFLFFQLFTFCRIRVIRG